MSRCSRYRVCTKASGHPNRGLGMSNRSTILLAMRLPTKAMLAAMAALTLLTAQSPFQRQEVREPRRAQVPEETAPRPAGEPIMAIVSIKSQHITFYDAEGWILRAPVSTGKTEHETPAGVF